MTDPTRASGRRLSDLPDLEPVFKQVLEGGVSQPKMCPACGKNIFYQYLGELPKTEMYVGRCKDCAYTVRVKGGPQ